MVNKTWGSFPRADQGLSGNADENLDVREPAPTEKLPSSVIGSDITVTGNIEATVDLLIEGKINGDVRCQTLLLGENSSIKGNIYAERVRVSGTVDGSIETGDLAIESMGNVTGDVTYARLKVATGGVVEGNMKCKREAEGKLKLVQPKAEVERIVIE